MVNDQPSLFAASAPTAIADAPQCRMCARPARWVKVRGAGAAGEWGMYCAGRSCSNRERICQQCGKPFAMKVDGAGTQYCSIACREARHHPERSTMPRCAWCGSLATDRPRPNAWPYICRPCLDPIKYVVHILKAHHVSAERAHRLKDDPTCEICGTNILAKKRERSHGQPKVLLVVDHDHDCCPVTSNSCGQCVRGLICRDCNTAAGLLADEPKRARALGDYLDAWINR